MFRRQSPICPIRFAKWSCCNYVGGLTLGQTEAAMELSPGTVKSRLNAALNKLRCVLE